MVLQYALCNPWDYFFTGTLDPERWDRNDLDAFMLDFSQKIRDWRKDYGLTFQVLLVPEHHEDGAWHIHGMISGLPSWCLYRFYWLPLRYVGLTAPFPKDLCDGRFVYWADFLDRYGFCSLAPIRDLVATAFYITKYISKDISQRSSDLGKHLYFHSRPLRKAEKASDVYYYNSQLEGYCDHDYDFCKTGFVQNAPWHFPYFWDGAEVPVKPMEDKPAKVDLQFPDFKPWELDPFYDQLKIENFRV